MDLVQFYYGSQIILTVIAGATAVGAYLQLQTYKRSEFLKTIEDPQVRSARRLLYRRLVSAQAPPNWWDEDEELALAAGAVCSAYDIVGIMARGKNRRFFIEEW